MALCVAMLIASEFMPVSLLTPIAHDLGATEGMAGQAISISGLFAVITSFVIATIAGRFDRRHVLIGLTGLMLSSLILIAVAPNFGVLMAARALLGVVIGGFWSLATATVMRLVSKDSVPKALGVIYTGNAVASAFAAPIGSYLGGIMGWRGVFWAMVPIAVVNLIWQWMTLPANAAPKVQFRRQGLWIAEAPQRCLCHARSDAHLCGLVCYFHLPATISRDLHPGKPVSAVSPIVRFRAGWICRYLWG
jgi:predicted MFS family arabinose efflux permease